MIEFLWTWAWFLKRRMLLRINYKSGIQEEFWVWYFFKRIKEDSSIEELKWIAVGRRNNVFMIGIKNIESIWVIDVKGILSMPESMEP